MKNIVIISSTPRKDGNSEKLAKKFYEGAVDAGNKVEFISLRDYKINYCKACYACEKLGKCIQDDDMNELTGKLLAADVIVFSTPVYFYTMSGQLKVFIDRLVGKYLEIHADIYLMCTAWDPDTSNLELALDSIRGATRDCFEECIEMGALAVGGVYEVGAIDGNNALNEAYDMGNKA